MVQRIAQETHKLNDKDLAYIKIAVCTAIDFYKNHRFSFNETYGYSFLLTDGQQSYPVADTVEVDGVTVVDTPQAGRGPIPAAPGTGTGGIDDGATGTGDDWEDEEVVPNGPPSDMVMPITTYCRVGGERWMELGVTTMEDIRYLTPTENATGYPEWYAWFGNAMHFHPIPEGGNVDIIRLDYVTDLGGPWYRWNGVDWSFFHPSGGATLSDSWTSPWLMDSAGGQLIRARAKWDLFYNVYHDTENAMMQAEHVGVALRNLRKTQTNLAHKMRRMPVII
jgi:hypothetical protein